MQLRIHPKMHWEGAHSWPPAFAGAYGRADVFPAPEKGELTRVDLVEAGNGLPRHLTLTVQHRGNDASGILCLDDEEVLPRLLEILNGCIGWTLSRIGDLDVDLDA